MTITIKTRLDPGVYMSQGGGEVVTKAEFSTGPRNLIKAIAERRAIHKSNVQGYGNLGCGRTWLEIDGTPIHAYDLDNVGYDDAQGYTKEALNFVTVKTRTEKARELLAEVAAGGYDEQTRYTYTE